MLPAEGHAAEKVDTRPELPQKDKSDMSMECETDKTALEDGDTQRANAQQIIDMPKHNLQETNMGNKPVHTLCVQQQSRIQSVKR